MAQTGFTLSDEGRTLTVLNDSGTTAIYAGDFVYSAANDDVTTGTAASARAGYAAGDVKVKSITCSASAYATIIGIAVQDIPADGYGAVAMEGIFLHPVSANTEAGDSLIVNASTDNFVVAISDNTTTVTAAVADTYRYQVGRALTGGSTSGKYIFWKLTL